VGLEYAESLLDRLGERDPLEVLAEVIDAVRDEVDACPAALRRVPEAPGKWSVAEVVRHLADMEGVYWYRLRRTLSQPGAAVLAVDQDAWASALDYAGSDIDESLEELGRLRELNLRWLRRRRADDWSVEGVHAERGPESLERMVRLLAGHDLAHRDQLGRIRRAVLSRG
jgi:hypothetical protein